MHPRQPAIREGAIDGADDRDPFFQTVMRSRNAFGGGPSESETLCQRTLSDRAGLQMLAPHPGWQGRLFH